MLRKLSWQQFLEWQHFDSVEPFGDMRSDWQAASICALMATIAAKGKKRFSPKDFLLQFGDARESKGKKQTWQEQKMIAQMLEAALSEPVKPERKKRK